MDLKGKKIKLLLQEKWAKWSEEKVVADKEWNDNVDLKMLSGEITQLRGRERT